nr:MAG TPA: hypothetical protein [Caudoviricetes sp.]
MISSESAFGVATNSIFLSRTFIYSFTSSCSSLHLYILYIVVTFLYMPFVPVYKGFIWIIQFYRSVSPSDFYRALLSSYGFRAFGYIYSIITSSMMGGVSIISGTPKSVSGTISNL